MSREDKRQREDGSAAGKVFAFIGVTLVVLILAALAAVGCVLWQLDWLPF
jgi:hypothetical protein